MQELERLVGGHPDVVARLLVDDRLHPAVDVLERVTLHNSCVCGWVEGEIFAKLEVDMYLSDTMCFQFYFNQVVVNLN